ncbi:hypothetical protein V8E36_005505 [Tilletia maclaganii]
MTASAHRRSWPSVDVDFSRPTGCFIPRLTTSAPSPPAPPTAFATSASAASCCRPHISDCIRAPSLVALPDRVGTQRFAASLLVPSAP